MKNANALLLSAAEFLDPITETNYAMMSLDRDITLPHYHDFYEFFIVLEGEAMHIVNDYRQVLDKGSLVFIRPCDKHQYQRIQSGSARQLDNRYSNDRAYIRFINIRVSSKLITSLFQYCNDENFRHYMTSSKIPPAMHLDEISTDNFNTDFNKIIRISFENYDIIKAEIRSYIYNLYMCLYRNYIIPRPYITSKHIDKQMKIPDWLTNICAVLHESDSLIAGRHTIRQFSYRNYSYVCRMFKKYLGLTPTEYINKLRLNYAGNLLKYSDQDITAISYESGFNNLSHFCHSFRRQYGMSPSEYRMKNQKRDV